MTDHLPARKSIDSDNSAFSKHSLISRKSTPTSPKSPLRLHFSILAPAAEPAPATPGVTEIKRERIPAASVALSSDPGYAQALVRTHYICELMDELRLAKGEKKAMVEMFLIKIVDKEYERACTFAARKHKALKMELAEVTSRLGRVSSPLTNNSRQMYLIRPFLESYVRESKAFFKEFGGSMLDERPQDENKKAVNEEKDAAFEQYFLKLKDGAKRLAQKCRSTYVTDSLKMLVKFEAEFHLLTCFIERVFTELTSFLRTIEELTQNRTAILRCSVSSRLGVIDSWLQETRTSLTCMVTDLIPDITDYECSICLGVMYKPVVLESCKHRFCRECLHQHERFSAFWAYLYWIDVQCPICRGSYTFRSKIPDAAMNNLIKMYFPKEYEEKSREEFKRRVQRKFVMMMRKRFSWRRDNFWE